MNLSRCTHAIDTTGLFLSPSKVIIIWNPGKYFLFFYSVFSHGLFFLLMDICSESGFY